MGSIKKINIEDPTDYFFNMIDIKNFDSNLLKIDKLNIINKNIDIYNIKHTTIKDLDYKNPHLIFSKIDGYIEENNENKYLIFASTDKDKEVLTKYFGIQKTLE